MTRCDRIVGGASRDRTDDLRVANATLSQLSYGPVPHDSYNHRRTSSLKTLERAADLVGLGGVEPPTSPLSGVRSNQLSYRPGGQRWVAHEGSNLNFRSTKQLNR